MMFDQNVGTVVGIPPLLNKVLKLTTCFPNVTDRICGWTNRQIDKQTDCQMDTISITTIQC